jgi:hypothetical protein
VAAQDTDIAEPPQERRAGCNLFLIAILLLLIAALAYWGYEASESGAPNPASTGVPPTAPPGATPH